LSKRGRWSGVAPWVAQAVRAGHFTWLNLATLRQLGGIAARLWTYLEAETYKQTAHGLASTWIGLGRPALATLGADRYRRSRDARRALGRAAARIVEVEARYASVTIEPRPGGWALVASRVVDRDRWKARREIVESLTTASGAGVARRAPRLGECPLGRAAQSATHLT
jgi:hypothetical protein